MISAQNHQPLLNGSNFLFVFMILVLLASCDSLKKAQGTTKNDKTEKEDNELEEIRGGKVYNPETGKFEETTDVSGAMDTVVWTDVSTDEFPPITSDGTMENGTRTGGSLGNSGGNKSSYNVAVMLPFLGNKYNEFDNKDSIVTEITEQFIRNDVHRCARISSNAKNAIEEILTMMTYVQKTLNNNPCSLWVSLSTLLHRNNQLNLFLFQAIVSLTKRKTQMPSTNQKKSPQTNRRN